MLIPFYLFIKITYGFIVSVTTHKKRINNLNEWSEFNKTMIGWVDEIKDEKIKHEYLLFCTEKVSKLNLVSIEELASGKSKFSASEIRKEIIEKYSKHIPSLKQELREEKLNKILK